MDDFISQVIDVLVSCGIDYGDSVNKFIAVLMILFCILRSFFKIILNCLFVSIIFDFIFSSEKHYKNKPEL